MKTVTLTAILLAVSNAAKVDWSGKWYLQPGSNDQCGPAGLITVAQAADGKANVKAKFDPFSAKCGEMEIKGEAFEITDGTTTDDSLTAKFKTKKNDEFTFVWSKDDKGKDQLAVTTTNGGSSSTSTHKSMQKKTDDDIAKMKALEGKYTFKIEQGDDTKCCIPQNIEVTELEAGLLYAKSKWANSAGCEAQKLKDYAWDKGKLSQIDPDSFNFEVTLADKTDNQYTLITDPKKNDGFWGFSNSRNGQECQVSASKAGGSGTGGGNGGGSGSGNGNKGKDDNKWWIWLIVVLVIVAVAGAGGFWYYRKRKADQLKSSLIYNTNYSA